LLQANIVILDADMRFMIIFDLTKHDDHTGWMIYRDMYAEETGTFCDKLLQLRKVIRSIYRRYQVLYENGIYPESLIIYKGTGCWVLHVHWYEYERDDWRVFRYLCKRKDESLAIKMTPTLLEYIGKKFRAEGIEEHLGSYKFVRIKYEP
jgi:hypothetical protein